MIFLSDIVFDEDEDIIGKNVRIDVIVWWILPESPINMEITPWNQKPAAAQIALNHGILPERIISKRIS